MFAMIGRWKLDHDQVDVQREVLTRRIVPGVRMADGFVAGYWSKPTANGEAYSFIVFDDRDAADAFADSPREPARPEHHGVSGDEVTVLELMAHA